MQLSDEEKQALKEKYKQQRREMWAGKRASGELEPEEETHPEVETDIQTHHVTNDHDHHAHSVNSAVPADSEDSATAAAQKGAIVQIAEEEFCPPDSTSQPSSQQIATGDADSRQLNPAEQKATALNTQTSETMRLMDKIKAQREEHHSIPQCRQTRVRKDQKTEEKPPPELKQKGKPAMLTWKLVLGVIGTIIVLIAIGIMLGIWFANQ